MQHLVSVIMPAYNAGRYVAESIRSVLAQTYSGWELIVVDDGSADDTAEIARGFAETDARVRVFSQPNGGQASARNAALREARGDLVAFLDSDDLWLPDKLRLQLDALDASGADVVSSDGYAFADDGSESADFFAIVAGATEGPEMVKLLYEYNRVATLSAVVRREAIDRVGPFDESRRLQNCEDYDLWLRLARAGCRFYATAEKLVRYRRHPASSTHRESKLLRPMIEVSKKHADCVGRGAARRRIRQRYRDLVTALLAENDLDGAREAMRDFASWDRGGLVTKCQRVLLRLSPANFNRVSRRWLYPAEWRLARLAGRLGAA